jgi:hypothetical protein
MRLALLSLAGSLLLFSLAGCGGKSCDATNCSGCCQGSICNAGTANAACGSSGAECSVCTNVQVCSADRTCGIDPSSNWKVQPSSAVVKNDNNGTPWDADSSPDPKVNLYCPAPASGVTSTTEISSNTFAPSWTSGGCILQAKDLLTSGFAYQVIDDDGLLSSGDSITGKTVVSVSNADLIAGKATTPAVDGLVSINIALTKQ